MKKVLIPVSKGFEEVELVSLVDVLRRGGLEICMAYLDEQTDSDVLVGDNGIRIQMDKALSDVNFQDFEMILLAGGWDNAYTLSDSEVVQKLLKSFYRDNKVVGAMCASVLALKKAEILGNNYTCYPYAKEEVNHEGYREDKMVVTDGNIMTSRGPGTALCFGLEIVKRLVGVESYDAVKEGMLLDFCE
jgi:4-methyl-5(b-hydroxyethyl)-thiazole monophosphate biosynthesis